MTLRKSLMACTAALSLTLAACATGERSGSSSDSSDQSAGVSSGQDTTSTPGTGSGSDTGMTSDTTSSSDSVSGDQSAGTSPTTSSTTGSSDQQMSMEQMQREMVLNRLHHINQHEIELAQLAQDKAQSTQVKSAAQMILTDHQKLDDQIKQSAQGFGFELQGYQAATHEKLGMDRIKNLSGSQFDQTFVKMMKMGHKEAGQLLKDMRADIKDSQLRTLIDATLPRIKAHRQMTVSLERDLRKSGTQQAGEASEAAGQMPSDSSSSSSTDHDHGSSQGAGTEGSSDSSTSTSTQ
jgi:putative membrane protein